MKSFRFPVSGPWLLACYPFFAGCSGAGSLEEREAAQQAAQAQVAHAAQVDASNTRRAEHASQLARLIESAKTQPVTSRVDALIAQAREQDAAREVVVYGVSKDPIGRTAQTVAELHARQLLLFAAGSEFRLQSGKLRIGSSGTISGVAVTSLKGHNDYHVVQLRAALPQPETVRDTGARVEEITKTTPLVSVVQSITEAVQGALVSAEATGDTNRQPGASKAITARGRVILKSMNLMAGKSPPQCVYTISVSWVTEAPPTAPPPPAP